MPPLAINAGWMSSTSSWRGAPGPDWASGSSCQDEFHESCDDRSSRTLADNSGVHYFSWER